MVKCITTKHRAPSHSIRPLASECRLREDQVVTVKSVYQKKLRSSQSTKRSHGQVKSTKRSHPVVVVITSLSAVVVVIVGTALIAVIFALWCRIEKKHR